MNYPCQVFATFHAEQAATISDDAEVSFDEAGSTQPEDPGTEQPEEPGAEQPDASADDDERAVTEVYASASADEELAHTGASQMPIVWIGRGVLALGAVALTTAKLRGRAKQQ